MKRSAKVWMVFVLGAWLALAGCGGGGGGTQQEDPGGGMAGPGDAGAVAPAPGDGGDPGSTGAAPGDPGAVVSPRALRLQGVVATGRAVSGAQVAIRCRAGSATTTADAAGRYSADIEDAAGPCMLRAQGDGEPLVSLVDADVAGVVTANVTPATHLLAARLLGRDPVGAFAACCTDETLVAAISGDAIRDAQEAVSAQLASRLGLPIPAGRWVRDAFAASPDDPLDRMLENLAHQLDEAGKSLAQATAELARVDEGLLVAEPLPTLACVPGLVPGAGTKDAQGMPRVHARFPGDAGAPDGAAAVVIGGAPGRFRNAHVTVDFADGRRFGPTRVDDATGVATLVPCGYDGTALVTLAGLDPDATYFDTALGRDASFHEQSLASVASIGAAIRVSGSIAVSPLTDAAHALLSGGSLDVSAPVAKATALRAGTIGPLQGLRLKAVPAPWHDEERVRIANRRVLDVVNDQLPGSYRIGDITSLPVLLDRENSADASDTLGVDEASRHAAILAGLASAGHAFDPDDPAPALTIARQFSADMSDGRLDMRRAGAPVAGAGRLAYTYDTLHRVYSLGVGALGRRIGDAAFQGLARPIDAWFQQMTNGHRVSLVLDTAGRLTEQFEPYFGTGIDERWRIEPMPVSELFGNMALALDRRNLLLTNIVAYASQPLDAVGETIELTAAGSGTSVRSLHRDRRPGAVLVFRRSDGSFARLSRETGIDGSTTTNVIEPFEVPPETVAIAIEGERTFGMTTDGRILVWETDQAATARELAPGAIGRVVAIDANDDGYAIYALTEEGEVYLLDADRALTLHPETSVILAPDPDAPPRRIDGLPKACQVSGGFVLDCEGRVWQIRSSPPDPGTTTYRVFYWDDPVVRLESLAERRIWRIRSQPAEWNRLVPSWGQLFLGVDGTVYDLSGRVISVQQAAPALVPDPGDE